MKTKIEIAEALALLEMTIHSPDLELAPKLAMCGCIETLTWVLGKETEDNGLLQTLNIIRRDNLTGELN